MGTKKIQEGKKTYVIDGKKDLLIYNKIKKLEKKKLSKQEKDIVNLIKTQLEKDWRKYLINYLNKLEEKYKKLKW